MKPFLFALALGTLANAAEPDTASLARQLTNTREFNETGVRFSPDGKRLFDYRQTAAKRTLRLDLGPGWEPHWTRADIRFSK